MLARTMSEFQFQDMLPLAKDETPYRLVTTDHVSTIEAAGKAFLQVEPAGLTRLAREAMRDIAHLLRPAHLAQLARILEDPEASPNDRFVATDLLKNAVISAGGVLPMCQDTGTAIIMGKKGQYVLTGGGGSANKSYLFQETKALLNPESLAAFVDAKIRTLGTAACPPYHLAVVIGGTSAEHALKVAKLASAHYLDTLPTEGNRLGRGFRDLDIEQKIFEIARRTGIGAQFGGKYFCHDVRVVRLPRHGASCPVAIAVSCSADRQALGKITREGIFLEQLETDPAKYLPETTERDLAGEVVKLDLSRPMSEIRAELGRYPIRTRLSLTGPMIVARDIAHAKIKERLDRGEGLPQYLRDYMVYYAGPAKTPAGYASGSFGPTTAGRMDAYVDLFQAHGGSFVMLAKGNRSAAVTAACKKHGGFYLGSIGGPAARLAQDCIKKVEVLEYPELGMEAVWKIEVVDFPAFIVVDDKGNDFFADITTPTTGKKLDIVR
jgi:fumarate hydratase class I